MGSNNGFTIFYKYVRKARVYNNFTIGSQGAYPQSVCKVRVLQQFLQYSHRCSVPCSYSFIYNIHTQRNWVAGSPLFPSLQFFLFHLNSICQQRELPLFLVAVAGKFFSFLFYSLLGEGMVTGATFISCHLGGVFKGWLSSRAYLYCWLPE